MKKRWTALLLALAMLSALAVGALADEQDKEKTAAEETAQTAPDAEGTLHFENLSARMRTGNYTLLSLEENIAAIECIDYDKMYEDLRDGLNSIASAQWGLIQMGQGESYTYETLTQRYDALRKTFDDIKEGKLQQDNADLVRQLRNAQASLLAAGESLYVGLLALEDQSAALTRQTAALDRTIEEVKLRYELGQVSAMTLQQTEAGKAQMESGKAAIDAAAAQLRRQLNAMIGEELTAPLTLNALPEVTAEQLAAMDVEKDLEKAKAVSYDLYAAKLTLEDADEEYKDKAGDLGYNEDNYEYIAVKHRWQAAQYTYNAAVQNFELSFRSLYDSVQSYASALNAAKVSLECERSDLAAAQLRYEQGTISENALHTAEDELYTAQDTVSGAERDLFTAYNNYRWAVDYGLLAG
jgi:outer membrane protein TolC